MRRSVPMQRLELTLPTATGNMALDDALLQHAERSGGAKGVVRIWESRSPLVVLGRGSRVTDEVELDRCRHDRVPVIRRVSGGAAVVVGHGCLMYALVLPRAAGGAALEAVHGQVLQPLAAALSDWGVSVARAGTSDLAVPAAAGGGSADLARKVSGNSVRLSRHYLLYHGTLLYDLDLSLVGRYLRMPPRMPEYREGRSHGDFLANVPLSGSDARHVLRQAWSVVDVTQNWPMQMTWQLERDRYARDDWNLRC